MAQNAIVAEHLNFEGLCLVFNRGPKATLEWCASHGLLKNSMRCPNPNCPFLAMPGNAQSQCKLYRYQTVSDGYRWFCSHCRSVKSVRDGSFFAKSNLTLKQIVLLVYCWAQKFPQWITQKETGISSDQTTVDWYNFCREVCKSYLINNPLVIGGLHPNGDRKVVEIDESLFFKRKYNVGRFRPDHWVFGGVERGTGKCFLVEVPDRTRVTLQNFIIQYIHPGSLIISDGWASYARISQIQGQNYDHKVVNHSINFVDPNDPNVHTNSIEGLWAHMKKKLRDQFGTSNALFVSHMHEFIYRNYHRIQKREFFNQFLLAIQDSYPV